MFEATDRWAAELLPPDKPRYFMGIGDPEGILEVIERGVDMFDCVLPTRTARTGSALTWEGRLNLRNAALRPRRAPDRRALRLPGLPALLARLRPAPRQPGGAARPAPPLPAQSTLPDRADSRARARRSSAASSPPTSATRSTGSCAAPRRVPARGSRARRDLVLSGSCSSGRSAAASAPAADAGHARGRRRDHHGGRPATRSSLEVDDEEVAGRDRARGRGCDARSGGAVCGGGPRARSRARARR